ncbi:MAG: GNAT family N-acetyltransferase [Pseudomonadota bacterium]
MLTIEAGTPEERAYLEVKLNEFNAQMVPRTQAESIIFVDFSLKDNNGAIVGGINALAYGWKVIFVNVLWIDKRYRHGGYGSRLLLQVEEEAVKMGCHLIHLDTFDFQAKDFYLKQGYEVFGELADCPTGHKRFFLKKVL